MKDAGGGGLEDFEGADRRQVDMVFADRGSGCDFYALRRFVAGYGAGESAGDVRAPGGSYACTAER